MGKAQAGRARREAGGLEGGKARKAASGPEVGAIYGKSGRAGAGMPAGERAVGRKMADWGKDINEKLPQWVTPKRVSVFLTAVFLLSLIPLLWIGWYNYPSADDYSIGSACRQAWVNSHSALAVIGEGIAMSAKDWVDWMGYFTSIFLMAVSPYCFSERLYVLTAWIMLGMLSFSTWYFLRAVFVKAFRADKHMGNCVIMLLLFVTVHCMVGRVEAFYWYCSAVNYTVGHSMSLLFYGLLISAAYDKGKKKAWDIGAASFLGFFTGGGNHMTALNVVIALFTTAGYLAYRKKWREYKIFALPMGLFFTGFLLNVLAPGNWVRAEGVRGMGPLKAVGVSFYYCLDYCMGEWSGWPVALLAAALAPLFWHMAKNTQFRFPCPLGAAAFGYCIVSAMMTPPLFAVGNLEAGRLRAVTFAMYLLTLTLCVGYVTGWARKKWERHAMSEENGEGTEAGGRFAPNTVWCLLGCLVFFLFAAAVTVVPEPHYFTFSSAITDLANGSAKAYGDALEARMGQYRSGEKDVVVEPLPAQPRLLYFSDITPDTEAWENRGLCRFYGLDSVRTGEE